MKKILVAIFGSASVMMTAHADIAGTVAHWSFDTPTLTVAAGNISGVADSTGVHNASPGSGLGAAGLSSNPIPASNSVAGRFGQGLTLTGVPGGNGQFLMFPELTEIMAINGAPNYTVAMWINTTTTTFNVFTDLASWGNSSANPGRFSYAFGPSGASQMRAQTRYDAGTNGTDIFARSVTTPAPLNDAAWHMLAWTFDTGSKVLTSYFDGLPVETFTSAAASSQMVTGSSTSGTLGFKGDTGTFLNGSISFDEMYVFRGAASDAQIQNLYLLNTIPEPDTLGLAGSGMLLVGIFRRRVL